MRPLSLLRRPNDTGNAADGGRMRDARARQFTDDEAAEAPTSVAVFLVNLREVGKPSFEERRTTVQYTPVLNFTNWLLNNQNTSLSLAFT